MTQDHPAVVNLAIVGSDSNNSRILNEQVHSFRYDVISDESPGGSHRYTVELINYDDRFMGGLIDVYSTFMGSDGTLIGSEPIISGSEQGLKATFPKLVIEWGYPGQMSGVHVAQVSNIQYKYTQGKERILVIEATDVSEIFEIYTKNIVKTPTRKFSMEVGNSSNSRKIPYLGLADGQGGPLEFHNIFFLILRDIITNIPGIHFEFVTPFKKYEFNDLLQSLLNGYSKAGYTEDFLYYDEDFAKLFTSTYDQPTYLYDAFNNASDVAQPALEREA